MSGGRERERKVGWRERGRGDGRGRESPQRAESKQGDMDGAHCITQSGDLELGQYCMNKWFYTRTKMFIIFNFPFRMKFGKYIISRLNRNIIRVLERIGIVSLYKEDI